MTRLVTGADDALADRRRPGEIELLERARACFRDARPLSGEGFCTFGPVNDRWYWSVCMPGDYMVFGGDARIPMSSKLTPCDRHLPEFEHVFRVIRICPACGVNELPPRCRKCTDCVG